MSGIPFGTVDLFVSKLQQASTSSKIEISGITYFLYLPLGDFYIQRDIGTTTRQAFAEEYVSNSHL